MRMSDLLISIVICLCICSCQNHRMPSNSVLYKMPAGSLEDLLPLGNGRLGVMSDGGVFRENITLNEVSMWPGNLPDSLRSNVLPCPFQIREKLLAGKDEQMQELRGRYLITGGLESELTEQVSAPCEMRQLLGNLHLEYFFRNVESQEYTDYERGVSLDDAVAWTHFKLGKTTYKREYFVSHADDVVVIKLSASKKEKLNFDVSLNRPECFSYYSNDDMLYMAGNLEGEGGHQGLGYLAQLKVILDNGTILADSAQIHVNGATTAYILVSGATNVENTNMAQMVDGLVSQASARKYEELKEAHIDAYRKKLVR